MEKRARNLLVRDRHGTFNRMAHVIKSATSPPCSQNQTTFFPSKLPQEVIQPTSGNNRKRVNRQALPHSPALQRKKRPQNQSERHLPTTLPLQFSTTDTTSAHPAWSASLSKLGSHRVERTEHHLAFDSPSYRSLGFEYSE